MQLGMLFPCERSLPLDELATQLGETVAAEPFDQALIDALGEFSRLIFHDPEARAYPELQALAFWLRKSEISRLAEQFRALGSCSRVLVPRGLVFHVPPRNVDTMFVYSWVLAALCGNRSVIRLSPQRAASTEILLRLLRATSGSYSGPLSATVIVSYGHEEEPTATLSELCDLRVIWGGDHTVNVIRRSPLRPHAREITFPDRYSLSAIKAGQYLAAPENRRDALADQFFNDAFWFDQLACSSPRLLIWCGTGEHAREASRDFFARVGQAIHRRRFTSQPAVSVQKLVSACSAVLNLPVDSCQRYPGLMVLNLNSMDSLDSLEQDHPGGGFFFQIRLDKLDDMVPLLRRRDQTLTWFGFTPDELHAFVRRLNGKAIDRVVPIGQALQFHRFWDGYDLLQEFCRTVHVDTAAAGSGAPH